MFDCNLVGITVVHDLFYLPPLVASDSCIAMCGTSDFSDVATNCEIF